MSNQLDTSCLFKGRFIIRIKNSSSETIPFFELFSVHDIPSAVKISFDLKYSTKEYGEEETETSGFYTLLDSILKEQEFNVWAVQAKRTGWMGGAAPVPSDIRLRWDKNGIGGSCIIDQKDDIHIYTFILGEKSTINLALYPNEEIEITFIFSDFDDFCDLQNFITTNHKAIKDKHIQSGDLYVADGEFVIRNTTNQSLKVNLFEYQGPVMSQPQGIQIVPEQKYMRFLSMISMQPVKLDGLFLRASDPKQLLNSMTLEKKSATGGIMQTPIQPSNYYSAMQTDMNTVDMPYQAILDGRAYFIIDLLPFSRLSVQMKISQNANSGQPSLLGKSATKIFGPPKIVKPTTINLPGINIPPGQIP